MLRNVIGKRYQIFRQFRFIILISIIIVQVIWTNNALEQLIITEYDKVEFGSFHMFVLRIQLFLNNY